MVNDINQLTQISKQLQPVVRNIETGNTAFAEVQTINPFEPMTTIFNNMNKQFVTYAKAMDGAKPYSNADAQNTSAAWKNVSRKTFVVQSSSLRSHVIVCRLPQELPNLVIGKSRVLEGNSLGPVAAVLQSHESILGMFEFGVLESAAGTSSVADVQKYNGSIDETLTLAIPAYAPGF